MFEKHNFILKCDGLLNYIILLYKKNNLAKFLRLNKNIKILKIKIEHYRFL